jgi:hypothetical protein
MTGKAELKSPADQNTDADKFLKKFAPRRGQGDGPYEPNPPWLRDFYENGFEVLWDAVKRLEEISHNGKSSASVGGPVIVPKSGPGPGPGKIPPPPPPAFP